jgi:hypothetical protein
MEPESTHEPDPLIPSFSPSGGEGARRADEGNSQRFKAPTHVRIWEVFAPPEAQSVQTKWCGDYFAAAFFFFAAGSCSGFDGS